MDNSPMRFESELIAHVRRYLDGETGFTELARWVDDHDSEWDTLELDSLSTRLGNAVMLTWYEQQHGDHSEQSLHSSVAEDFAEIVGSRAST